MTSKLSFKQIITAGLTAAVVAAVINAILFFVFHSLGTITDDIFVQPNQPLTIVPVIMASIVPSIVASLVFFLMEKYTNNGFRVFSIISILFMLASLAGPFMGIKGITTGYALVLCAMHIVVTVCLLYFFSRANKTKAK